MDVHRYGVFFVFAEGILWSTVGLGICLIEEAVVWQILLYRSVSMSFFLYVVIHLRSGESPFVQIRCIGFTAVIAGIALVAAYSGGSLFWRDLFNPEYFCRKSDATICNCAVFGGNFGLGSFA